MAYSTGINKETGQVLTDWGHVVQSIKCILTTPIGSRIMRRDFGSEVMELIDRPQTDRVILAIYAATANALMPRIVNGRQYGEPRFQLTGCHLVSVDESGRLALALTGAFMPRGHLGDRTSANNNAVAEVVLRAA